MKRIQYNAYISLSIALSVSSQTFSAGRPAATASPSALLGMGTRCENIPASKLHSYGTCPLMRYDLVKVSNIVNLHSCGLWKCVDMAC